MNGNAISCYSSLGRQPDMSLEPDFADKETRKG